MYCQKNKRSVSQVEIWYQSRQVSNSSPYYYYVPSEHEEQDGGEADGGVVPPGRRGEDQEARHQVSARLQRSERRGKSYFYVPGGITDNVQKYAVYFMLVFHRYAACCEGALQREEESVLATGSSRSTARASLRCPTRGSSTSSQLPLERYVPILLNQDELRFAICDVNDNWSWWL